MKVNRVLMMFFSPNGTTSRICRTIGLATAKRLGATAESYDFTRPEQRDAYPAFDEHTLSLFASPVYAGRIPNVLLPYLSALRGCGAAVPLAVFGNRGDDETLSEWKRLLLAGGFFVPAAAAFVGQHSFSQTLAAGRPDQADLVIAQHFSEELMRRSRNWDEQTAVPLPFDGEELRYYKPQTQSGEALNFLRARPEVSAACVHCGACALVCPVGSIDAEGRNNGGICIKCNACVHACPRQARRITDPAYLAHKRDLEETCTQRREPVCYFAQGFAETEDACAGACRGV